MENHLKKIITGISEFKIIPFLGAGMSEKLGFKLWGELITDLKAELASNTKDYLQVAQEYEDKFGRDKLMSILKENYDKPINPKLLDLHYLLLSMDPPIVYTTNYDNAIETAAAMLKRNYSKIASLSNIVDAPHFARQIIKFHGDFTAPDNIVFTRTDYNKRLETQHALDIQFRANLLGKGLLFLGYGFGDENIDLIFETHARLYGTDLLPLSYLIAFEHNEKKEASLLSKNILTVHLESPTELATLIKEINQKVFNRNIANEIKNISKPIQRETLLLSEIDNLKSYFEMKTHSNQVKAEKLRSTIESKEMDKTTENSLVQFLIELIGKDTTSPEVIEAIIFAYPYIELRENASAFELAINIINLARHDCLYEGMLYAKNVDPLGTLEGTIGTVKMAHILIYYLKIMKQQGDSLSKNQVARIFDMLNQCGYPEIPDMHERFTQKEMEQIVNSYLLLNRDLNSVLFRKTITPRRTISQIINEMSALLPTKLEN